jgi:hypothetical protein
MSRRKPRPKRNKVPQPKPQKGFDKSAAKAKQYMRQRRGNW